MASSALDAREKPLLRGVSHEIAAFAAALGGFALVRAAPSARAAAGAAVYVATLTTLFAVSAVYHRPTWKPRARALLRRFDHSAIFLLIAGTYTPFCLLLGGRAGLLLLAAAWSGAALGVAQLFAGGLAYTAGAIVYAMRRPDPAPRVFGYHEVFHALVIAAAVCHYAVVAGAVAAIR